MDRYGEPVKVLEILEIDVANLPVCCYLGRSLKEVKTMKPKRGAHAISGAAVTTLSV